jgi:hypothetical protein
MSLQVLRNSGIDAILNPGTSANPDTDVGAVHDALEALAAITSASEEGHLVCLQSGAIGAATSSLQVNTWQFGPCDHSSGFGGNAANQQYGPVVAEDIWQVLSIVLQDAVAHPQLAPLSVAFLVALLHGASRFELLSGRQRLEGVGKDAPAYAAVFQSVTTISSPC